MGRFRGAAADDDTPESEECDDGDGYIGSFDVRSR
jgi:hypothetical protein